MLKEKIKNGEKLIGMYVHLNEISISRIAGLAGYDVVWVDTEHSYLSCHDVYEHIIALKSTGTDVVVRAPQHDFTFTKKIMEAGPDGIIFPNVKSAKEVNELISYTLYPPYGTRSFGPLGATDYGMEDVPEYVKTNHNTMCRFIQLENKNVIAELGEIMKNQYIDGYIFGPNDLSGSYNMLLDVYTDKITGIITETTKKLHENGKYVGVASGGYSEEIIRHWSKTGADIIFAGTDFEFLRDGAINNRKNLEKIHKHII